METPHYFCPFIFRSTKENNMKMDLPKESGIYCFENLVNSKKYVGQAQDIYVRIMAHIRELKRNVDNSKLLQKAWNKYGEENFKIYVIELAQIEKLNDMEIYYIAYLRSHYSENGYNISYGGESVMRGLKHSQETKKKMSEIRIGTKQTDDTKRKISDSWKTRVVSEETRVKISISRMGSTVSVETKKKISEAQLGVPHTQETKNNIAKSKLGKKRGKNTSSEYVGVYFRKDISKWTAVICNIYLGSYENEIDAAIAYNNKAIELYGENTKLNIIEEEDNE